MKKQLEKKFVENWKVLTVDSIFLNLIYEIFIMSDILNVQKTNCRNALELRDPKN